MEAKERIQSYDAISGIMIVYMIFTHVMQWIGLSECMVYVSLQRILFFFMPWFAFKAGVFFSIKSIREVFFGGLKSLIIPFFVFSFIGWIFWSIDHLLIGDLTGKSFFRIPFFELLYMGSIKGNLPLWWLPSLFVSRIIFNLILRCNTYLSLAIAVLISLCPLSIMCVLGFSPIHFYNGNIPLIILFLAFGYYLRDVGNNRVLICISSIVYLLGVFVFPAFVDFRSCRVLQGNFYWWIIICLSGILVYNAFSKRISFRLPVLTHIGQYSIFYFSGHWLVIYLFHLFRLL